MTSIRTLRANVSEEEAVRLLGRGFAFRFRPGLKRIADVYLPFQSFEVSIEQDERRSVQVFAIDLLSGKLDPYAFVGDVPQMIEVETRNHPPCVLSVESARAKAVERARRAMYQHGFFRLKEPSITASALGELFHVPYWIGFYGADDSLRISVLDAVRRRREGAKVVEAVNSWLLHDALVS